MEETEKTAAQEELSSQSGGETHHHSHHSHHHSHHHGSGHHHHKHHRRENVFRRMKRKFRRFRAEQKEKWAPGTPGAKLKRRVGLVLLAVMIPTVILVGARHLEKRNTVDPSTAVYYNTTPGANEPVRYNGKTYLPNTNLKTYLFMGIDASGPVKEVSYIGGGQADTLLLLIVDQDAKTWDILQINRDTITEVQTLGVLGDVVDVRRTQIALAHSYGDGKKTSCRNTVKAVSDLLGGCESNGYMSLNMDGIRLLVDGVGGVDVTLAEDYPEFGSDMKKGATVHLDGERAYEYLRYRRDVADQTNLDRMSRHRSFMSAFVRKLEDMTNSATADLYESLTDYMVTDMTDGEMWEVVNRLQRYEFRGITTLKGTAVVEKGVMAYYLDEESLPETILQLFYHIEE